MTGNVDHLGVWVLYTAILAACTWTTIHNLRRGKR